MKNMTDRLPSYDEIVDRNAIKLLQSPGDLTLRSGDIAVTRRGDLMLDSEDYSAFVRLVQLWRHNFPTLLTLFNAAFQALENREVAKRELDLLGSHKWEPANGPLGGLDISAYHANLERIDAEKGAHGIYAGTITLVLNRALASFKADISATLDEWQRAGTQIKGHSVGAVLEAASNNMRHADEWETAATAPTQQQLKSVHILSAVLDEPIPANGSIRRFARDISPEILDILCARDFLRLERTVFDFANALLALRQKRKPAA